MCILLALCIVLVASLQLTTFVYTDVVADMATDNLGAMNLTGSSNCDFAACELAHEDARVTFTSHTGM